MVAGLPRASLRAPCLDAHRAGELQIAAGIDFGSCTILCFDSLQAGYASEHAGEIAGLLAEWAVQVHPACVGKQVLHRPQACICSSLL